MSKQVNVSGFIIRIGKGSLRKIEKSGSVYDGKIMVVAPFSIYNIRSTKRHFANDDYNYIIHGSVQKHGVKADYGFKDSLVNCWVDPKKERTGFIRIPYDGRGKYGVMIHAGQKSQYRSIIWEINSILTQAPPVNNENSVPPQLGPSKMVKPTKKNPYRVETASSSPKKQSNMKTHKAHFSSKETFYSPDGLDMQDYYINQDYSRKNEFGHGRKRNLEWNDNKARELKESLSSLRKLQKFDPNTFDRGAMK